MAKLKQVVEGPRIEITGQMERFDIVKKVVTMFIEFEKSHKGKGIEFRYPVEDLSNGEKLYIYRPGIKWNFDFKVEIPANCGLDEGRHDQIALILRKIKKEKKQEFNNLYKIISDLYHCSSNDVDDLLQRNPVSLKSPPPDILLKVIKWLFIMEDIIYWHYEGRAFLYNFFVYVVNEEDESRLERVISGIRGRKVKPERIKRLLVQIGIEWKSP
jgi:hypothetical protein